MAAAFPNPPPAWAAANNHFNPPSIHAACTLLVFSLLSLNHNNDAGVRMTICSQIKGYVRNHERIADFSSLLAVALLFSTIWFAIDYQASIFTWTKQSILLHGPAVIFLLVLDVFIIIVLLNIGSTRLEGPEGMHSDRCFGTFRGRRHGGFNFGTAFRNWVQHIEQVNKKHR